MIISQKPKVEFAPSQIAQEQLLVIDTVGSSSISSNFGVNFTRYESAAGHYDILITGLNIESGVIVGGADSELVDASEFPLITRISPSTDYANINISNGRAITDPFEITFKKITADPYYGAPITFDEGSYSEFSYDLVIALANASPNNKWLTGSDLNHLDTRVNLATFPHQALSGIAVKGLQANGCRPIAITKRHIVTAAHYGIGPANIGSKCYWRDATNGALIEKTIIAVLSGFETSNPDFGFDTVIMLLNSDLPASITPMKIAGHWAGNSLIDVDEQDYVTYTGYFGITVWGRDGEWQPSFRLSVQPEEQGWFLAAGRNYGSFPEESQYTYWQMSPGFNGNATTSFWLGWG